MTISILISTLLQLGIISNDSAFNEVNIQQYLDETSSTSIIIVDDATEL